MLNIFYITDAAECNGCIILDAKTFDRVLSKFDVMVVKFDKHNPDQKKHESFEKIYSDLSSEIGMENLMTAHVDVLNNGMVKNNELIDKYNLHSDIFDEKKLPAIFTFIRYKEGENKDGNESHWKARFDNTPSIFDTDAIKRHIRQVTAIYFTLPGCLDNFDFLAIKFAGEFTKFKQGSIVSEAEVQLSKIPESDTTKRSIAKEYIKWMRNAMESGDNTAAYLHQETEKILSELNKPGSLTEEEKQNKRNALNIFDAFHLAGRFQMVEAPEHDEL